MSIFLSVGSMCAAILDKLREKLKKRVEEVVASADPQRPEQEVVLLAQKMDVAEEMDRLIAHVNEVRCMPARLWRSPIIARARAHTERY